MSIDFLTECDVEMNFIASHCPAATVIPILLRTVDLQDTPFENFQCLPRTGLPIAEYRSRDKVLQEIASEIREVICSQSPPPKKQSREKEEKLKAMIADRRGFMQDRLSSFVGRQSELIEIQRRIEEKLKSGGYVTITGQAGQGKSSIIAQEQHHRHLDRILW